MTLLISDQTTAGAVTPDGINPLLGYINVVPKESSVSHYEITPIQYTAIFNGCKNGYFYTKTYIL